MALNVSYWHSENWSSYRMLEAGVGVENIGQPPERAKKGSGTPAH